MIRTRVITSRSFQSIMTDETLANDLTTMNIQYFYEKIEENQTDFVDNYPHLTARNVAINELIMSEQRFVNDMKTILKTYITPMLENQILSPSHIDALFLNWPNLTRIHEKLANELINAFKFNGEDISVGRILSEFIPQLTQEYEVYFRFHPIAMKCFHQQLRKSSKFRLFMQKTKVQTSGIGTMGDANILTLPLQRIAKYPFLLDQIIKNTSNTNSDLEQLASSLTKSNQLQETINNAIDEELNRVKFDWLQTHVDCRKLSETIIFNSLTHFGEQRKLIHYNYLKDSKQTFYAMLFNDFFLLTKVQRPLIRKFWQIFYRQSQNNFDWFETPTNIHLYLIIYKKPIMLHEIRNLRINEIDLKSFRFDYRGRDMNFRTNSINERLLWMKYFTDSIEICRQQCLVTSMFRAPESSFLSQSMGKLVIHEIQTRNLPIFSRQNLHPYCIVKLNDSQRQTTPVLSEIKEFQWIVTFEFFIRNFQDEKIQFYIYNQSKYTTDRLLGSIEIPISCLIDKSNEYEDSLSISSDFSSINWKQQTFDLQNSSKYSQLFLKYHFFTHH